MFGLDVNMDKDTGIHYGVIQTNNAPGLFETMEPVYPEPETEDDEDYMDCEPIGWEYQDEQYILVDCLDSCTMVIKSPYITYCRLCSPCVPNAGDLDTPDDLGYEAYCLGPDFFDEYSPIPYKVYDAVTKEEIKPK